MVEFAYQNFILVLLQIVMVCLNSYILFLFYFILIYFLWFSILFCIFYFLDDEKAYDCSHIMS